MLQYSCLENPLSDREAWQATVYRVAKSWTWLKWHCAYRCKTCIAFGSSAQWELSVKVVQLLGFRWLYQRQVCRAMDCLRRRNYGAISVFFQSSYSRRSEGLFGQSLSITPPIQILGRIPCLGSFSVVQHIMYIESPSPHHPQTPPPRGSYSVDWRIRHLKGHPGWGPTL